MDIKNWPVLRDIILFFGGMGGVAHETIVAASERPTLLILFAAMMGLPAFLRHDGGADAVGPKADKSSGPSE